MPRSGSKRFFSDFETGFRSFFVHFFSTLVVVFCRLDVPLPRYERKRFFNDFETGFTAFTVRFFALWCLFCVDWTYHCQDTGEKVCSLTLKLVLRHSTFVFERFGSFFVLIRRTFAIIRTKMFFIDFQIGFTAFAVRFCALSWFFCIDRTYLCQNT